MTTKCPQCGEIELNLIDNTRHSFIQEFACAKCGYFEMRERPKKDLDSFTDQSFARFLKEEGLKDERRTHQLAYLRGVKDGIVLCEATIKKQAE